MLSHWKKIVPAFLTAGLLLTAFERTRTDRLMVDSAQALLASLYPDQKKKIAFALDNLDERTHWLYTPFERHGLMLKEMSPTQQRLAEALLAAGLASQGLIKAHTIMSLDTLLFIQEKDGNLERDPSKYYFSIFGDPKTEGTWGYRFEGHHVSLNYTVVNGKIASTPSFFGSNPAEVLEGKRKGLRVLGREQDLGQKMIASLTAEQQAVAIVDQKPYTDILTTNSRKAALTGQPNGLPVSKMTAAQKAILDEVVAEYAYDFPSDIADTRLAQYKRLQNEAFFAWSGSTKPAGRHYYRIQTPEFMIEYDKAQEDGNHIHSVWRDFKNDWGEDLLAAHLKAAH